MQSTDGAPKFPRIGRHDLRGSRGRAFVVGDIHGSFNQLSKALADRRYKPDVDTLFMLGDLVDRGGHSLAAAHWLDLPRVRGNHEEMTWAAATGSARDVEFHVDNGGAWLQALDPDHQRDFAARLMAAPLAIELLTPRGRRVGLVHADVEGDDWPAFLERLGDPVNHRTEQVALWSRQRFAQVEADPWYLPHIAGIDHVCFGHSVVPAPLARGNCSWIDTGAGWGADLSVIDIDAHLDAVAAAVGACAAPALSL